MLWIHHIVITVGTLVTAAAMLTYLRGRVEKLLGRLTDAARTDPLTGMPNRVALHEVLESEIDRAQPHGRPVSLIVLDLDRFKRINESLGLPGGDRALRQVSHLLDENVRRMDFVSGLAARSSRSSCRRRTSTRPSCSPRTVPLIDQLGRRSAMSALFAQGSFRAFRTASRAAFEYGSTASSASTRNTP